MKLLDNVYLVGSGQIGLSHSFDCNAYLVNGGDELALIDSGAGLGTSAILRNIEEDGFDIRKLTKIVLTHHHADHAGGCKRLREITGARICIHEAGAQLARRGNPEEIGLTVAKHSGLYSRSYTFDAFEADCHIGDGQDVAVGTVRLRTFHTPGHSQDCACFYLDGESGRCLFSGDVVDSEGRIGLLNLPGSDLSSYREGFGKIASLPCDALFPGHGLFVFKGARRQIHRAFLALGKISPPPNFA